MISNENIEKASVESLPSLMDDEWEMVVRVSSFKKGVEFALGELKNLSIEFLDSIRDYERENGNRICFDERTSEELFYTFLKTKGYGSF